MCCILTKKRLCCILISLSFFTLCLANNNQNSFEARSKRVHKAFQAYLSQNTFDTTLALKRFFLFMRPEEINLALKDIRKFIRRYFTTEIKNNGIKNLGRQRVGDVLHSYGYVIRFIEAAWVDRATHRIIQAKEDQTFVRNADPLVDYWWFIEKTQGVKLHCYKFYASCIDRLVVMMNANLIRPCRDCAQLRDMESRWLWWLRKMAGKLHNNKTWGAQYHQVVKTFGELFTMWKNDYHKNQNNFRRSQAWSYQNNQF